MTAADAALTSSTSNLLRDRAINTRLPDKGIHTWLIRCPAGVNVANSAGQIELDILRAGNEQTSRWRRAEQTAET
ncbi:hypothetical protein [uncultured Mycobacterium sp.]|uniref:hypothetical protein n=1 Tax=uncultured Mycobacterium sp. TaxID=171292 RepID=UPI0035CB3D7C